MHLDLEEFSKTCNAVGHHGFHNHKPFKNTTVRDFFYSRTRVSWFVFFWLTDWLAGWLTLAVSFHGSEVTLLKFQREPHSPPSLEEVCRHPHGLEWVALGLRPPFGRDGHHCHVGAGRQAAKVLRQDQERGVGLPPLCAEDQLLLCTGAFHGGAARRPVLQAAEGILAKSQCRLRFLCVSRCCAGMPVARGQPGVPVPPSPLPQDLPLRWHP